MDQNELPLDSHHVGVPSVAPKMIYEPMICLTQTVHLSCVEINTIYKQTKIILHLIYAIYEYHMVCPKAISEPMVHLAQTVHLSCVEINIISK
jgi:hypothetical protein